MNVVGGRKLLSEARARWRGQPRLHFEGPRPDVAAWFEGKSFTTDWLGSKLDPWLAALASFREMPVQVLELGAFEGRSAIAFLEYLPLSHVSSVDRFVFVTKHADGSDGLTVEDRFDANLKSYGPRITKIKGSVLSVLDDLTRSRARFDVIYIDAGKQRDSVFANTAAAWPLLKVDGIIIWDDLDWGSKLPSANRPGDAISLFARSFAPCLDILHQRSQLIARKTSDWPGI